MLQDDDELWASLEVAKDEPRAATKSSAAEKKKTSTKSKSKRGSDDHGSDDDEGDDDGDDGNSAPVKSLETASRGKSSSSAGAKKLQSATADKSRSSRSSRSKIDSNNNDDDDDDGDDSNNGKSKGSSGKNGNSVTGRARSADQGKMNLFSAFFKASGSILFSSSFSREFLSGWFLMSAPNSCQSCRRRHLDEEKVARRQIERQKKEFAV